MPRHAKKFLPVGLAKPISVEQALLRTGFLFTKQNESLGFQLESKANKDFLNRLLVHVGLNILDGGRLLSPQKEIDQSSWIETWQEYSGGAEGGPSGLLSIELPIMDSYLSGIARWLTALGYVTVGSCDGHGRRLPRLYLKDRSQENEVATLIERSTKDKMTYAYPFVCPNAWQGRDKFYVELLDLAELLHARAEESLEKVFQGNRIAYL